MKNWCEYNGHGVYSGDECPECKKYNSPLALTITMILILVIALLYLFLVRR